VPRPSLMVSGYPEDLEAIVMKALARTRIERYQTARELSRALQSLLMRRGLFVGGDEVAAYMTSIFGDRLQERDAHLRWAADVTQTMDIDEAKPLPATRHEREDATTLSYEDSDVQLAPSSPARSAISREASPPLPRAVVDPGAIVDADDTVVCDSMLVMDDLLRTAAPSTPPKPTAPASAPAQSMATASPRPPPALVSPGPPPVETPARATRRSNEGVLVWTVAVGAILVGVALIALVVALWRRFSTS